MLPIATYRKWAVELVEYACGYSVGRPEDDIVYKAVTENRDVGAMQKKYSSCGDLTHWLLYRLGVRSQWVNRAEHGGFLSSDLYNNITLLQKSPALLRDPNTGMRYQPGDIGIIWGTGFDAHVFVVLDDQQPKALYVGEYGQPGGHLAARTIGYHAGLLTIGVKALHKVLPLGDVLSAADAAGELGQAENVRAYAARLNLPPPDVRSSDTDPANVSTEPPPPSEPARPDPIQQPHLRRGDKGPAVELLQRRLNELGAPVPLKVDGDFGAKTEAAVMAFKRSRMLASPVVDVYCWQELLK